MSIYETPNMYQTCLETAKGISRRQFLRPSSPPQSPTSGSRLHAHAMACRLRERHLMHRLDAGSVYVAGVPVCVRCFEYVSLYLFFELGIALFGFGIQKGKPFGFHVQGSANLAHWGCQNSDPRAKKKGSMFLLVSVEPT